MSSPSVICPCHSHLDTGTISLRSKSPPRSKEYVKVTSERYSDGQWVKSKGLLLHWNLELRTVFPPDEEPLRTNCESEQILELLQDKIWVPRVAEAEWELLLPPACSGCRATLRSSNPT